MAINKTLKFLKAVACACLIMLVYSCPGEEDCFDIGSTSRENDLISLLPVQQTYSQNDEITLSLLIPSNNTYFGNEIDLYLVTADESAQLILGFNELFIDNDLTFIKGSMDNAGSNNWFNVDYNPLTENYELEIIIKLEKVGFYSLRSDDRIIFQGSDNCNSFRLDTNVAWSTFGIVEFTVTE